MTGAVLGAAALAVSAGAGIYSAVNTSNYESSMMNLAQGKAGEQQYYANMLQSLIDNPSSVASLPGYSFQFNQGADAISREMAASGFGGSGNEAIALDQYGQNFAQSAYGQQVNLLASLSGLTASSSPAQYAAAGLTAGNSSFSQLGQAFSSLGYGLQNFSGGAAYSPSDMQIMASGGPSSTMSMGNYTVNTPW